MFRFQRFELFYTPILLILCSSIAAAGFTPLDNYLISCGSATNVTLDNRVFVSDGLGSNLVKTNKDILATSKSVPNSPLHQTARIFTQTSEFRIPISRIGRHWIRIHFSPFRYESYDMGSSTFSVFTDNYVLLSNFNIKNGSTLKEYNFNVTVGTLSVTFAPSLKSFAFVNALEVVSIPDELISDIARSVSTSQTFNGLLNYALETVARVNMGGRAVSPLNDTLTRTWVTQEGFLLRPNLAKTVSNIAAVSYVEGGATQNIAPSSVYGTAAEMNSADNPNSNFNVTWEFDVVSGFQYFLRFHFCDIVSTAPNQLYFNVFLDASIVVSNIDLTSLTGSLSAAYYLDVVTLDVNTGKLTVSVGPSNLVPGYPNAILNGLEIMKINNSLGSLDGPAPTVTRSRSVSAVVIVCVSIGVGVGLLGLLVLLFATSRKRRREQERLGLLKTWLPFSMNGTKSHTMGSKSSYGTAASPGSNLGYRFPFAAVQDATNKFDESWVIGIGGFGKVYKGTMSDGTKVAVKRGNSRSQQGLAEFQTEIELLSQFRHRHLVSLIGYCDEKKEMILIYEYMENGTLKSHLYGSGFPSMGWKERVEACIGAARGLHYLHTGYAKAVIHRDVKSANILLDENLMAKVADFGLSKTGPEIDQTHVSTAVKGSFGYLDPEYFRRQQLTEKSDVYSFGVVLFEVVCARPVIDPSLNREMVNLAEWAMKWQKKGELESIMDWSLVGKVRPESLRKFGETAEKCLGEFGVDRPAMGDVLWNLEYALQLQEAVVEGEMEEENSTNLIGDLSPQVNNFSHVESSVFEESNVSELSGVSMSRVFSQLVKSEGR